MNPARHAMEMTAIEQIWKFKDRTAADSRRLTLRDADATAVELCLEGYPKQGWGDMKETVLVPRSPASADLLRIALPWPNSFGRTVDLDLARILVEGGAASLGEMTERAPVSILLGDYAPWASLPAAYRAELGLGRYPNLRTRFCRRLEALKKGERLEWRVSSVLRAYLRGSMQAFPAGGWFSETLLEWLLRRPVELSAKAAKTESQDTDSRSHYGKEVFWKAFAAWIRMEPGLMLGRETVCGRALRTILASPELKWLNDSLDRLEGEPPDRKGSAGTIRALLESLGLPGSVRETRARLMAGRALETAPEPGLEPVL